MLRDNDRCVMTGYICELRTLDRSDPHQKITHVTPMLLIPRFVDRPIDAGNAKLGTMYQFVKAYCNVDLEIDGFDNFDNAISLGSDVRTRFLNCLLWLHQDDQNPQLSSECVYRVGGVAGTITEELEDKFLTEISCTPYMHAFGVVVAQVPDPRRIAFHRSMGQIIYLSGVARLE
ncbi:hypothetical protein CVT24_003265 [Panaeolus cyanescens]|uniref:Uncharacterized protein n=1 Tax=Panaeolus cyanescens TaxID=181874 RepID=A0A409YXN4_9AGAR|nr:hypothetical protein CVT24_003265 [Panaeolus cyanescens]